MYWVSFDYVLGLFWPCIGSLLAMYLVSFGYVLGLTIYMLRDRCQKKPSTEGKRLTLEAKETY